MQLNPQFSRPQFVVALDIHPVVYTKYPFAPFWVRALSWPMHTAK